MSALKMLDKNLEAHRSSSNVVTLCAFELWRLLGYPIQPLCNAGDLAGQLSCDICMPSPTRQGDKDVFHPHQVGNMEGTECKGVQQ